MNYAVIETGGKQYKVNEGMIIEVDNLSKKPQEDHVFDKILLFAEDEVVKVGKPYLSEFEVTAKVLENKKLDKIRVSKFKAKSRHRRSSGYRHSVTKLIIEKIKSKEK